MGEEQQVQAYMRGKILTEKLQSSYHMIFDRSLGEVQLPGDGFMGHPFFPGHFENLFLLGRELVDQLRQDLFVLAGADTEIGVVDSGGKVFCIRFPAPGLRSPFPEQRIHLVVRHGNQVAFEIPDVEELAAPVPQ